MTSTERDELVRELRERANELGTAYQSDIDLLHRAANFLASTSREKVLEEAATVADEWAKYGYEGAKGIAAVIRSLQPEGEG